MTAQGAIVSDIASELRSATNDVNRWRGRCVESFARVELAVAEALDAMAASKSTPAFKPAVLLGQRIETLRNLLEDGHFGENATSSLEALKELKGALDHRNVIVHGVGQIWIGPEGRWLWRYRYVANDRGRTEKHGAIDSKQALELEHRLSENTRRLRDTLRKLRTGL